FVPHASSSSTRRGPCSTSTAAASRFTSPSPALIVSSRCSATSSSPPIATAMPPCAYAVFDSASSSLVTTITLPTPARQIAALRPAIPAPTTRKSVCSISRCYYPGTATTRDTMEISCPSFHSRRPPPPTTSPSPQACCALSPRASTSW